MHFVQTFVARFQTVHDLHLNLRELNVVNLKNELENVSRKVLQMNEGG